ncbi:uncharacterized protein [Triticum aestivum]|uniref:uncharacterized protein n=1 Tax=Triticum aestivum TaxID=4565 RepID=UPI001D02D6EB|nr:uncharacterized protein LOC123117704 [Triticum aestivum]
MKNIILMDQGMEGWPLMNWTKLSFPQNMDLLAKKVQKSWCSHPWNPTMTRIRTPLFWHIFASAKTVKTSTSFDVIGELCDQNKQMVGPQNRADPYVDQGNEDMIQGTPATIWRKGSATLDGEKSESMDYCEDLLKFVDLSESENEELTEEDLGVLPPEAIHILQSETLKRSLLDSLNQAQKEGVIPEKGVKWGPVVAKKPNTRGHGNINIMEKAAAYKRKKNLEVPETFKGGRNLVVLVSLILGILTWPS